MVTFATRRAGRHWRRGLESCVLTRKNFNYFSRALRFVLGLYGRTQMRVGILEITQNHDSQPFSLHLHTATLAQSWPLTSAKRWRKLRVQYNYACACASPTNRKALVRENPRTDKFKLPDKQQQTSNALFVNSDTLFYTS